MLNFWDFSVWAWINTFAVLLGILLVGNMLKRSIPFLRDRVRIPNDVPCNTRARTPLPCTHHLRPLLRCDEYHPFQKQDIRKKE